jgi:hypothetical protein
LIGVIRNVIEFRILSNSNGSIWITLIFKCECLDRVIKNFILNILGSLINSKVLGQIWKIGTNL